MAERFLRWVGFLWKVSIKCICVCAFLDRYADYPDLELWNNSVYSMHILANNNNNLLHLYSALHKMGGNSSNTTNVQHSPDIATAAILRQNAHHRPAYWCRGDRVMKTIIVGMIPMMDRGQWANLARIMGLNHNSCRSVTSKHSRRRTTYLFGFETLSFVTLHRSYTCTNSYNTVRKLSI